MQISPTVLKISLSHISVLMRKFREEKTRLTQYDVAQRMGVSRAYIQQLESGKANYSFEVFFKYCIAVGAKFSIQLMNQHEWIEVSKDAPLFIDEEKYNKFINL